MPTSPSLSDPRLAALADAATRAGIFLDHDGSLSPIVADPAAARPIEGAIEVLGQLAERFAVVAVVSGRPVGFLRAVLGDPPRVRLYGLYGMERLIGGVATRSPAATAMTEAADRAAASLRELLGDASVEHKGPAVAVHFRGSDDPDAARRDAEPLVRAVAVREGFAVHEGRLVLELVPARGGDKGDVVREVIAADRLTAAMVAGDDRGDLAAFAALRGVEPAVRVLVASAETPEDLRAAADIAVDGPAGLLTLLRGLVAL